MSGFQVSRERITETHTQRRGRWIQNVTCSLYLFLQDLYISHACHKYQQPSLAAKLLPTAGNGLPVTQLGEGLGGHLD